MFRRKPDTTAHDIAVLRSQIESLTKQHQYRVEPHGDVWKAYVVEYEYSRYRISCYECPGEAFFGATKASAVKKLKTALLCGTAPSFRELTGPLR